MANKNQKEVRWLQRAADQSGQRRKMEKHKKLAQVFLSSLFVFLLSFASATQAFALEVPVSQTEQMIDGKQTLVRVYEVSSDLDPETLIEDDFAQNGYMYTMTSIVKDTVVVEDEKEITQEYSVTVEVSDEDDARLEALMSMPAFIEYEEDGYVGKLYSVPSSLSGEETGRTNHSGVKRVTETYTYDYNDDSLVPTSSSGYSLTNITWSEGSYIADTSIPENYIATATYSKAYSYSTVDGWTFTMSYVGDVEYEHEDVTRYTLTYTGQLIEPEEEPGFFARLFGTKSSSGTSDTDVNESATPGTSDTDVNESATPGSNSASSYRISAWKVILGILLALILCAAIAFVVLTLVKFLKNNRVTIYAQDEETGDFSPFKAVWFKQKDSTISIDTLASPATRHFRIAFKPALAEQLRGKVITVKAGQRVFKHTIGNVGGTDYFIDVNLDS